MPLLHEELLAVARVLEDAHVPYALVGGLAVAVWGAPRATSDIDLLVELADIPTAKAAVARIGFVLAAEPMDFSDGMQIQRVSKIEDGQLVVVDFLLVNSNLRRYFLDRVTVSIEGTALSVISREGLIAMKISAGRPQDQADVIRLMEMDR